MDSKGGYLVTVLDRETARQIDRTWQPFGQWKEIGLWLDNFGYNDSRFSVDIKFTEGNPG